LFAEAVRRYYGSQDCALFVIPQDLLLQWQREARTGASAPSVPHAWYQPTIASSELGVARNAGVSLSRSILPS
jgi:hypothetical protein